MNISNLTLALDLDSFSFLRRHPNEYNFTLVFSSYLHCEWASLEQLEKDKRIHQKIKRFKTKHAQMRHIFQEVRRKLMLKPLILGCGSAA